MADVPKHLWHLCQQLHAQNQQPSVALLRSHSQIPVSIQQAVKAVQRWKANPTPLEPEAKLIPEKGRKPIPPNATMALEERVCQLERRVKELTSQVEQLLKLHQSSESG